MNAIAAIIVLCLSLLGYVVWIDVTSEKIELKKSDWACVKHETKLIHVRSGSVTVLQPVEKCVLYQKS